MFRIGLGLRIRKSSAMSLPYKRRLWRQSSAQSKRSNNGNEYRRAPDRAQSLLANGRGRSDVNGAHVGITITGGEALGRHLFDTAQVARTQFDVDCGGIFLEIFAPLGSGNRHDILSARKHPGERELARGDALLRRDSIHALDHREIAIEVLALEARVQAAEVALREIVERLVLAAQKPAPERTVRDQADAQLAQRREHFVLDIAAPQ